MKLLKIILLDFKESIEEKNIYHSFIIYNCVWHTISIEAIIFKPN
jgi:hypothetical protein